MPRRRVEVVVDLNVGDITVPDAPVRIPAELEGGSGGGRGPGGGGGRRPQTPEWQARLTNILGPTLGPALGRNLTWVRNLIGELGGLGTIAAWVLVPLAALATTLYTVYRMSSLCWGALVKVGEALVKAAVAGFKLALDWARRFTEGVWSLIVVSLKALVEGAKRAAVALWHLAVRGLKSATDYFAEFQQEAATTVTVMGKFGDAALAARAEVMQFSEDVAARSRYSSQEVAKAMYEMHSAGFTAMGDVKALTEASLNLASATVTDVSPAMELMGSTINTYKLQAQDASAVSDIFFNAIAQSPARMDKLIESMRYAGPIASTLGLSLKETVAELEAFYTRGVSASMAGTLFRQALNGLMRTSDKAKAAFKAVGEDLGKFDPVRAGGLIPVIRQFEALEQRIGKSRVRELIFKAFEMRAAFGISILLDTGSEKLKAFEAGLGQSGTAAAAAADQMNTLQGAWTKLIHVAQNLGTELLSGGAGNALQGLLEWVTGLIDRAKQFGAFRELGTAVDFVARTVEAAVGGVLPTVEQSFVAILPLIGYVLLALANGLQQAMPFVQGFLAWLPTLVAQIATGLVPALLRLALTALPLLVRLAEEGLPLAVHILIALATAVQTLLAQGGDGLVTLFLNWGAALLRMVQLLPTLVPYLVYFLSLILSAPQRIAGLVTTLLPLLLAVMVWLVGTVATLMAQIEAGATQWLPLLYQWFVATWNAAKPALLWLLEVFNAFFGLMQGLAQLLPFIVTLLWLLSSPLALLEALGSTLLAIFGGLAWLVEKLVDGFTWLADKLGMGWLRDAFKTTADAYGGAEKFADNAARMGGDAFKAWFMAPEAAAKIGPAAAQAAGWGQQATQAAGGAVRGWPPPATMPHLPPQGLPPISPGQVRQAAATADQAQQSGRPPAWASPTPPAAATAPGTRPPPKTTNLSNPSPGGGYWSAGGSPVTPGGRLVPGAAAGGSIDVNLSVPPDWEALKRAFAQWADQQSRQDLLRQRLGGPGTGGPSAGAWAPQPGSPAANGAVRRFGTAPS